MNILKKVISIVYDFRVSDEYNLNVDYTKTIEELVEAGKFVNYARYISSETFPDEIKSGSCNLKIKILYISKGSSKDVVLEYISKCKARPANLKELLSFGIKFPGMWDLDCLMALSSIFYGSLWSGPDFLTPPVDSIGVATLSKIEPNHSMVMVKDRQFFYQDSDCFLIVLR